MVTERRELRLRHALHGLHAPPPPKTPLNRAGAGAGTEAGARTRQLGLPRSQTVCGSLGAAAMTPAAKRPEQIPAESHLRSSQAV